MFIFSDPLLCHLYASPATFSPPWPASLAPPAPPVRHPALPEPKVKSKVDIPPHSTFLEREQLLKLVREVYTSPPTPISPLKTSLDSVPASQSESGGDAGGGKDCYGPRALRGVYKGHSGPYRHTFCPGEPAGSSRTTPNMNN